MLEAEQRLRGRLNEDLRAAMKARDAVRVAAVRSLIAALDNASAVALTDAEAAAVRRLAESSGSRSPPGAFDVPRRVLSEEDMLRVFAIERAERHSAAHSLEKHGCYEEAVLVRTELEIIEAYLASVFGSSASAG
jgi:uncharacterized protein